MSDSDGDFSDELLELAGAGEKKRKSRQSKPAAKRRKPDVESDSDHEYESEEDDFNPYPLEGKYIDEADRMKLTQMPEIERENIIAQRLEEMQNLQDKRNLDQMLKAQGRPDSDSVSKAAKRAHPVRGATKEKSRKLDELKAKRKAKGEKKKVKANSPKRERSSSPMDMEMSSDDEEDGQISKFEQEEEREQRLLNKAKVEDEPITLTDLEDCHVRRDQLCKYSKRSWFEDYAKGAWVRYLIGQDKGEPVYRICEITNISPNSAKPYRIEGEFYDQQLELKHGKSEKAFNMDKVSNSPFTQKEFERLIAQMKFDQVKLPTKQTLKKKREQLTKLPEQLITEMDIAAMLARKTAMQPSRLSSSAVAMERSRLQQLLNLAVKRHDVQEVAELNRQFAELEANTASDSKQKEEPEDVLAIVNERNRKANAEAIRKAEVAEAERKRRERRLALQSASRAGTPSDPAARLKSRLGSVARSETPNGTPKLRALLDGSTTPRPTSPFPGGIAPKDALTRVASTLEVDLGDF